MSGMVRSSASSTSIVLSLSLADLCGVGSVVGFVSDGPLSGSLGTSICWIVGMDDVGEDLSTSIAILESTNVKVCIQLDYVATRIVYKG